LPTSEELIEQHEEKPSRIPRIEDMPKPPEFIKIPEDTASLPQPPKVQQTEEVGVDGDDPITNVVTLPIVSELPPSWALVIDKVLHQELGIHSTLPLLWENSLKGQVERVMVIAPEPLFTYAGHIDVSHKICHAMPQSQAEEFVKWLGAQVFLRRRTGQYVECVIHSTTLGIQRAQYNAYVAVPATAKKQVRTTLGSVPLTMADFPPDPDVIRRSKVILTDPSAILSSIELGRL